jgi:hypothetical protein
VRVTGTLHPQLCRHEQLFLSYGGTLDRTPDRGLATVGCGGVNVPTPGSHTSSSVIWKTPKPTIGVFTPLFRVTSSDASLLRQISQARSGWDGQVFPLYWDKSEFESKLLPVMDTFQ